MFPWKSASDQAQPLFKDLVRLLVNWCFEPSPPLGIISRLKETYVMKYRVERTNKAKYNTGRTESEHEDLWGEFMDEIQLKGP